jgi:hypothetical protein
MLVLMLRAGVLETQDPTPAVTSKARRDNVAGVLTFCGSAAAGSAKRVT